MLSADAVSRSQDSAMPEVRFTPGLFSFPANKLSLLFLLRTI